MKKMVVVLALLAAVCSAKAAMVDWSVSATADDVGKTVYLLTSIGDFADSSALASAAVDSAAVASAGRGKYSTPIKTAQGDAVTATANYYYAIIGADGNSFNYVAADGIGAKVYDPNAQETSKGTYNAVSYSAIAAGTSKTFGGTPTPPPGPGPDGDVPEPTSGLLLLVGGAMLALRRKQK